LFGGPNILMYYSIFGGHVPLSLTIQLLTSLWSNDKQDIYLGLANQAISYKNLADGRNQTENMMEYSCHYPSSHVRKKNTQYLGSTVGTTILSTLLMLPVSYLEDCDGLYGSLKYGTKQKI
jgi:hypothetical protein